MASTAPTTEQLAHKIAELVLGIKIILFLFLLVISIGNVGEALSIDYFKRILSEALPGRDLPPLTLIVVQQKHLWLFAAWLLPALGLGALFIRERIRLSIGLLGAILALAVLQCGAVGAALVVPLIDLAPSASG